MSPLPTMARLALDGLMEWICPPRCAACDRPLTPFEWVLCDVCAASLVPIEGHRCPHCGGPSLRGACWECRQAPPPFRSARSVYAYGGSLAQVIRRFKYGRRLDLARPLGALLEPALLGREHLVVPIPSSRAALAERGFDPIMEILRALPHVRWAPLLGRKDHRPAQAGRPALERRMLGPEAFHLRSRAEVGREPLYLLDDVLTTGATVRAGATVLRAAGAAAVHVITLARSEVGDQGIDSNDVTLPDRVVRARPGW